MSQVARTSGSAADVQDGAEGAGGAGGAGAAGRYDPRTGEQLVDVRVRVNGIARDLQVPGRRLLSDALRHDLRLTGTHVGCEHGVCGACTILLDGVPVRSCLTLAASVDGHEVTTVEGLAAPDGTLHPVQQAFQDCHGLQCGFCTPGFVTTIAAFIKENPDPDEDDALEAVSGNLCRCTGYQNIKAAVIHAAELARRAESHDDQAASPPDRATEGQEVRP